MGALSGSLAVIADGMHSATDALSSLTGLVTNKLSDPQPDRDHPYGHRKYEAVGALGIAGFILFTAIEILLRSGERLLEGLPPIRVTGQELVLLTLVLGFNLLLAGYELREGRRLNSNCSRRMPSMRRATFGPPWWSGGQRGGLDAGELA